jgi:hypothetical protein
MALKIGAGIVPGHSSWLLLIFAFFLLSCSNSNQAVNRAESILAVSRGTIAIFNWDGSKAIAASDSQGNEMYGLKANHCKIETLSDTFFFEGAGFNKATINSTGGSKIEIDTHLMARKAFQAANSRRPSTDIIFNTAENWGKSLSDAWNSIPSSARPSLVNQAQFEAATMMFVGLDKRGELKPYLTWVSYDRFQNLFVVHAPHQPAEGAVVNVSGIDQDLLAEFYTGSSERSKKEFEVWRKQYGNDPDQFYVQLIRWLIMYDTTKTVGGDPEVITLSSHGAVHWVAPCREP